MPERQDEDRSHHYPEGVDMSDQESTSRTDDNTLARPDVEGHRSWHVSPDADDDVEGHKWAGGQTEDEDVEGHVKMRMQPPRGDEDVEGHRIS